MMSVVIESDYYTYVPGSSPQSIPEFFRWYITTPSMEERDVNPFTLDVMYTDDLSYIKIVNMSFEAMRPGSYSINKIYNETGWNIHFSIVQKGSNNGGIPCSPNTPYCDNIPLNIPSPTINVENDDENSYMYSLGVHEEIGKAPFGDKYLEILTHQDSSKGITAIQLDNLLDIQTYLSAHKGKLLKVVIAIEVVNMSWGLSSIDVDLQLTVFGSIVLFNHTEAKIAVTNKWIIIPAFIKLPENEPINKLEISVLITPYGQVYMEDSYIKFDFLGIYIIHRIIRPIRIILSRDQWVVWLVKSIIDDQVSADTYMPEDYRNALDDLISKIEKNVSSGEEYKIDLGYIVITWDVAPPITTYYGTTYRTFVSITTSISIIMSNVDTEIENNTNQVIGFTQIARASRSAKDAIDNTIEVTPLFRIEYPAITKVQIHDNEVNSYAKIKWGINNVMVTDTNSAKYKIISFNSNAEIIHTLIHTEKEVVNSGIGTATTALTYESVIFGIGSLVLALIPGLQPLAVILGISSSVGGALALTLSIIAPSYVQEIKRVVTLEDNYLSSPSEPATADTLFSYIVNTGARKGEDRIRYFIRWYDHDRNKLEINYATAITDKSYDKFLSNLTLYSWIHSIYIPPDLLNQQDSPIALTDEDINIQYTLYLSIVEHFADNDSCKYIKVNAYEQIIYNDHYKIHIRGKLYGS